MKVGDEIALENVLIAYDDEENEIHLPPRTIRGCVVEIDGLRAKVALSISSQKLHVYIDVV